MSNENNENETTLTLTEAWNLWQTSQDAVVTAQEAQAEALRDVARAAGTKTFMHEGQLYQVRERKVKATGEYQPFICALKRAPKEWLADAREAKYAEAGAGEQVAQTPVTEPAVEPTVTEDSSAISGAALFGDDTPVVLD